MGASEKTVTRADDLARRPPRMQPRQGRCPSPPALSPSRALTNSSQLEDPFIGTGPNSLPLAFYQWQFNRRIEMVTKLGFHDGSKQSFRDDPGQRLSEPILGRESSERSGLSRRSQISVGNAAVSDWGGGNL